MKPEEALIDILIFSGLAQVFFAGIGCLTIGQMTIADDDTRKKAIELAFRYGPSGALCLLIAYLIQNAPK